MHRYSPEQLALLILENSILAGLIFRVLVTGLYRKYPSFFGYLLVAAAQALVLGSLSGNSPSYQYLWVITQALLTCFCALIVLELYAQIFHDLAGIATRSRRYLKIFMGLAILVSSLFLLLEQTPHGVVNTFLVIDRVLTGSLLIFMLLLTAFLVYYPVPINRNLVVYSIGCAVYFMAKASSLLVVNISHTWYRQINIVVIAASTISMLFWLVGLSRQGEEKTLVIGHRWNREDQEQVLARLKAINERLLGGDRPES